MAQSFQMHWPAERPRKAYQERLVMGYVMLVCAVLASLALGVLVAYGICQAMFRIFRTHAESAARSRVAGPQLRTVRS